MTIRLVIAEDHRVVAEALATMLRFDGDFEVVAITGSGSEVLDLVAEHEPDVVLMDVGLKGLNGIEATRRLRAGDPPSPNVVMLTMHDDEATVTDAVAAGAVGFLPKNVQRHELEDAVRAVAGGEGFLHPSVTSRFLRKVGPMADSLGADRLTDRELDVLEQLVEGLTTRQIAEQLILGEETVKSHLAHIYQKLGVNDRVQAVALAIRRGLVP